MLKKIKQILEKTMALLAIMSLLSVYLPALSLMSFATDSITSLDTPTNLKWKEGSTATATWDAVENANYYIVNVYVYDGSELLGNEKTGTANNELDIQQEITKILSGNRYTSFQVTFDVKAQYIDDSMVIESDYSTSSSTLNITPKGNTKYETPTNIELDANLNASWNAINNVDYYKVYFYITYNGKTNSTWDLIEPRQGTTLNGVFKYNITSKINYLYRTYGYNGEQVQASFKVQATPSVINSTYIDSDYSESSNTMEYCCNTIIKYETPTNIKLDSNLNASWSAINNVDYYKVYFYITYNGKTNSTWDLIEPRQGITLNGVFKYNITSKINYLYRTYGYNGEQVQASFKVQAIPSTYNSKYSQSDISVYANNVLYYKDDIIKYDTPTNLTLDGNCNASWSAISNVDYYKVYFYITYNGNIYSTWDLIDPREGITSNGVFKYNIRSKVNYLYKTYVATGETVEMSFKVQAMPSTDNSKYSKSNYSQTSNTSYYNPNGSTEIDNITLSPNKPVIAVGRTMYIGKTIDPNNVYYSTINWSTSDNSIVSINNMGQITGIKKGNATITAQINNATQNADVSVYEIESNINDSVEVVDVINEANNVIEAIITDGDISNTDITDKEAVINEIEQGAQNGDMFNVDIKYDNKTATEYNNIEDMINAIYDGYSIAGGNDIKITISHTDNKGTEHHIANIIELENEVNVKFDMPTNIPKLSKTKEREYKLVRYHNENIETIDFEINNGIIETSSDKFSDFVLLYKDTDIPTFEISGEITSYNSDTDEISIQLYKEGITEVFDEQRVKGNNTNYTIQDVPSGNYTIKFIKNNHVSREYLITVNNSNLVQDAQICLIGDINGDGKTNNKDWNRMYKHINGTNVLTDYQLLCADVNEDGKVNNKDWNRLYNHINGTDLLY